MINFLNKYYQKAGLKRFLSLAGLLCFICDVGNLAYINIYWFQKKLNLNTIKFALEANGLDTSQMSRYDIEAYRSLLIDALGLVFAIFLLYHIFVYFKFTRNKLWAKKYVFGYALTGSILTVVELPMLVRDNWLWAMVMFCTTIIYLYTFLGIRYFKKQEQ
jgi:succinate dehydrogenase/fumarate reductase cytochrome b subunit